MAPAGKHDQAPVDTCDPLPLGHRAMLQAGFGSDVLGGLRKFPIAQRAQQVAGEEHALPAPCKQEISALLQSVLGLAADVDVWGASELL